MKSISALLFSVAFILFCVAFGFCLFVLCFPFGLFHPIIAAEPTTLVLGAIDSDKEVECHFTIRNTGNKPLELSEIVPACGSGNEILVDDFSPTPVLPGNTCDIFVRFRPFICQGETERKLVVGSNDPQFPQLVLSVKAAVNFIPPDKSQEPTFAQPRERDTSLPIAIPEKGNS